MRSSHSLDRLDVAFDDERLVADAGLLLPATLAQHLGLRELVDEHLDLGPAAGRANVGDKLLTLVMSALAGGDCIDDAGALGAGGTGRVLGFLIRAGDTRRKVTDVRRDHVSGVPENGRRPDRHIVAVPKAWPRLDVGLVKRDELQSWDQKTKQDPR